MDERKRYIVKPGDTLSEIAYNLFGAAALWRIRLEKENGETYTEAEARRIRPGQIIYYYDIESSNNSPEITHKEFLTFCNLTNLDWHYVELFEQTTGRKRNNVFLKDLLTPESFARYNADQEFYYYPYLNVTCEGRNPMLTEELREKGMAVLREKAGIAMEYLEKWQLWEETGGAKGNEEGKFIGDWELVYGADNYKIVADFLDELTDGDIEYPTREECKERERALQKIEQTVKLISFTIQAGSVLLPHFIEIRVAGAYKPLLAKGLVNELRILGSSRMIKQNLAAMARTVKSRIDTNQLYAVYAFANEGSQFTTGAINFAKDKVSNYISEEERKDIEYKVEELSSLGSDRDYLLDDEVKLTLNHKLSMFDTKFRVLVLKRGSDIVITYRLPDERRTEGFLPEELELMNIVYSKISREYRIDNYNIYFSGIDGGGDLSIISSLQYNNPSTIFATSSYQIKGLVNFTEKDINTDFHSIYEISLEAGKGLAKEIGITLLLSLVFVGGASLPLTLMFALIGAVFSFLKECWKSFQLSRIIEVLKSEPLSYLSRDEVEGIEGFITNKYNFDESIAFNHDDMEIRVRKADVLYYIFRTSSYPELRVINNGEDEDSDIYYFSLIESGFAVAYHYKLILRKGEGDFYYIAEKETTIIQGNSYPQVNHPTFREAFADKEGEGFKNLLDITSAMQRNYLNESRAEIETIYYYTDSDDNGSVRISNDFMEIEQEGRTKYVHKNEYVFMPFLTIEGNIGNELREEYIISVVKSKVMRYKDFKANEFRYQLIADGNNSILDSLNYNTVQEHEDTIKQVKYGLDDEFPNECKHDFDEENVTQELIDIMENNEMIDFLNINRSLESREQGPVVLFNHRDLILKYLEENPDMLEQYYVIEDIDEDIWEIFRWRVWSNITGLLVINPEAESLMEYKYNPFDFIIGGKLEVYADDLPEEVIPVEEDGDIQSNEGEASLNSIEYNIPYINSDYLNIYPENTRNTMEFFSTEPDRKDQSIMETGEVDLSSDINKYSEIYLLVDDGDYAVSAEKREKNLLENLDLN